MISTLDVAILSGMHHGIEEAETNTFIFLDLISRASNKLEDVSHEMDRKCFTPMWEVRGTP